MFIVSLDYIAPVEKLDACLEEHRDLLAEGIQAGYLLGAGRKVPRTGGVMLLNLKNRAEVEAFIHRDPFHKQNLATYSITEVQMTVMSPALEALLK